MSSTQCVCAPRRSSLCFQLTVGCLLPLLLLLPAAWCRELERREREEKEKEKEERRRQERVNRWVGGCRVGGGWVVRCFASGGLGASVTGCGMRIQASGVPCSLNASEQCVWCTTHRCDACPGVCGWVGVGAGTPSGRCWPSTAPRESSTPPPAGRWVLPWALPWVPRSGKGGRSPSLWCAPLSPLYLTAYPTVPPVLPVLPPSPANPAGLPAYSEGGGIVHCGGAQRRGQPPQGALPGGCCTPCWVLRSLPHGRCRGRQPGSRRGMPWPILATAPCLHVLAVDRRLPCCRPPHRVSIISCHLPCILSFLPSFFPACLQDILEEMEGEYLKQRDALKAAAKERGLEVRWLGRGGAAHGGPWLAGLGCVWPSGCVMHCAVVAWLSSCCLAHTVHLVLLATT